jgi:hypothetical protein
MYLPGLLNTQNLAAMMKISFLVIKAGLKADLFTTINSGEKSDLIIKFLAGNHTIEYYENNSIVPARIKEIKVTE